DAIFYDELDYVVKIKSKKRFYFLEAFNNFESFGTPHSYLEGADGYSIEYDEPDRYYKAVIPRSTFNDNIERQHYTIEFTEAMDIVQAERTSSYLGNPKSEYISNANLDRSYLAADFAKYYVEPKEKGKKKKDDPSPVTTDA